MVKAQPQNKKRQVTSPPLYGGFSSVQPPQRQQRPPKPQPVFSPKPSSVPSPTYRPVPVTTPGPTASYDPFNFQANPTERIDSIFDDEEGVEPSAAPDYSEESTVVPVYLTSEYPELRRPKKDSTSGGAPPKENEISER